MPGVAACDSYTPLAMVLVSVVTELGCRSGPSLTEEGACEARVRAPEGRVGRRRLSGRDAQERFPTARTEPEIRYRLGVKPRQILDMECTIPRLLYLFVLLYGMYACRGVLLRLCVCVAGCG